MYIFKIFFAIFDLFENFINFFLYHFIAATNEHRHCATVGALL
jgi:hypothetical protein